MKTNKENQLMTADIYRHIY